METNETRSAALARVANGAQQTLDAWRGTDAGAKYPVLADETTLAMLDESVTKRAPWRFYRQAPTFRVAPLGSLFLRIHRWHGGSGALDGFMFARWDADSLARHESLTERYSEAVRTDITSPSFFDRLDTTCLVIRRGNSPAGRAWAQALGTGRADR